MIYMVWSFCSVNNLISPKKWKSMTLYYCTYISPSNGFLSPNAAC